MKTNYLKMIGMALAGLGMLCLFEADSANSKASRQEMDELIEDKVINKFAEKYEGQLCPFCFHHSRNFHPILWKDTHYHNKGELLCVKLVLILRALIVNTWKLDGLRMTSVTKLGLLARCLLKACC